MQLELSMTTTVQLKGYDNSPTATGSLRDGVPVGQWKFFYPRTRKLWQTGKYDARGLKTGTWKIFDGNGTLSAEISYTHAKPTGIKWAPGAIDLGFAQTTDLFFHPGIEIQELKPK